jgi:hypothetical protein
MGGDKMSDEVLIEKKTYISKLLLDITDILIEKFFDFDSDELLDEKIEVLTALKEGKEPGQIPRYYDILELYPKSENGVSIHWD